MKKIKSALGLAYLRQTVLVGSVALALVAAHRASAVAVLKAEYLFNNNLKSSVLGAPDLLPTDPLGLNTFATDAGRSVYSWDGNASPVTQQAGLTFDNSGNLITPNNYSVQMIFKLTGLAGSWRRLIDVQNRQSDNGFYVDPSNQLDVFPVSGGGVFVRNTYEDVVLSDSAGVVKAYLNGTLAFTANTTVMDINNPQKFMNFFLDNVVGGGQGEFSDGSIDTLRLYDGVLDPSAVPDAGSTFSLSGAFLALVAFRWWHGRQARKAHV